MATRIRRPLRDGNSVSRRALALFGDGLQANSQHATERAPIAICPQREGVIHLSTDLSRFEQAGLGGGSAAGQLG